MMKKTIVLTGLVCGLALQGNGCCGGAETCAPTQTTDNNAVKKDGPSTTKEVIQEAYGKVADGGGVCELFGGGCCGGGADISQYLGYTEKELNELSGANLGLGCGNPVTLGAIEKGATVLDLGSGAGLDCLLAARKVGIEGKVIGVDMTETMINKARENAKKLEVKNVEFRLGDIEKLPVDSNTVDVVMSNCVINLAPDKAAVFKEAHRVLKAGGKMYVSDVVLLGDLTAEQKKDEKLLCACVGGALLKSDYVGLIEKTGFEVNVVGEDTEINKKWFGDDSLPISSLKFIATKK